MKALRTMLVLAVLVIATVALTGAASAAAADVIDVTDEVSYTITANTPYVGRPVITSVSGLAGYITGYVYDTPLSYTVYQTTVTTTTVTNGSDSENVTVTKKVVTKPIGIVDESAVKINGDGTATTTVKGVKYTADVAFPKDTTLHTIAGPVANSEQSIIFENGKPVKTVTATGEASFDSAFYNDLSNIIGYTPLIEKQPFMNPWNLWML